MINNNIELWTSIYGEHTLNESEAEAAITKAVFKYTECGCSFMSNSTGIFLSGYAEGSDAELPVHDLEWGFTYEDWNHTMADADAEGVEEWHLANGEENEE